jgi:hypothetical protein
LDAGQIEAILTALRTPASHDDTARQCLDYVDGNCACMDYAVFRWAGLCTSTGVVEAGCKTPIGVPCKRGRGLDGGGSRRHHRPPVLHA